MAYRTGNIAPQLDLEEHAVIGDSEVGVKKVVIMDSLGNQADVGGIYESALYSDASYDYLCEAIPGTALNSASWRVSRIDAVGREVYADRDTNFDNLATDLATVAGLDYT